MIVLSLMATALAGSVRGDPVSLEKVVERSDVVVRGVVDVGPRSEVVEPLVPGDPDRCGTYTVRLSHLTVAEVLVDRIGAAPDGFIEIRAATADLSIEVGREMCLNNDSRSYRVRSYEGSVPWKTAAEVVVFLDKSDSGWKFAVPDGFDSVSKWEESTMTPAKAIARRHDKPLIVAHRGASGYAPENTVSAYKKAIQLGATVHETDVLLTADRKVVAMHDDTVDRTTNGSGKVSELSIETLRGLDAGSWFDPAFAGEPVPTLADLLRTLQPHEGHVMCVEIKEGRGIGPRIKQIAETTGMLDRIILFSFGADALREAHEAMPGVPALFLIHTYDERYDPGIVKAVRPTGATMLGVKHSAVDKALVDAAHAEGLPLFVYTVNEPADMTRLAELGVDVIITNFPDRAAATLK